MSIHCCSRCGASIEIHSAPGEHITCWDCVVSEVRMLADREEEVRRVIEAALRTRVWTPNGWVTLQ